MSAIPDRLAAALQDRYRIERPLGEGGMATVYLAEDVKHDRKVALKVLKPELAAVLGAERFVVEIKTTAALQHPHILPLFDSGEADGFLFYVMPFVDGETLRDRLNRDTQLGVDEAIRITREIADALHYAHEHGVVHRDIKPENILLANGRPMVADFGIALALSAAAGGRMTETGLSLGTPHYMSPEQATAEKEITGRSDVYSLASVLYEMLAGAPPHVGGSAQQIIMRIIADTPRPVTELRKSVPPNVAAALSRALEKLPADRFESAKAFSEALEDRHFTTVSEGAAVPALSGSGLRQWLRSPLSLAALSSLVVALGALSVQASRRTDEELPQPVVAFTLEDSLPFAGTGIAIADDGTIVRIVDGKLLVRRPGELTMTELPLPEGLRAFNRPVISPDGREVVHSVVTGRLDAQRYALRRTSLADGSWSTLWAASGEREFAFPVAWGDDGWVYFSGVFDGVSRPTVRVRDSGGDVQQVLPFPVTAGTLLPGAKVFIGCRFTSTGWDVFAADLATGDTTSVAIDVCPPTWLTTGHLLLPYRDGTLRALPFDPDRRVVTGPPTPVLEGMAMLRLRAAYAVSRSGTLVYVAGPVTDPDSRAGRPIAIVSLDGRVTDIPLRPTNHGDGAFSPDGRTLAYIRDDQVWLYDLELGTHRQFTRTGTEHHNPVWSPDGKRLAYRALRSEGNAGDVYVQALEGDSIGRHIGGTSDRADNPFQWLSDDRILVQTGLPEDILTLRVDQPGAPEPVLQADWNESEPSVSPDGRWLAYVSWETGRPQLVVRAWPRLDKRTLAAESDERLEQPFWSPDGRTLYHQDGDRLIALSLSGRDSLSVTQRRVVIERLDGIVRAIHPDGRRFLVFRSPGAATDSRSPQNSIVVVTGWLTAVKQRLAAGAPR